MLSRGGDLEVLRSHRPFQRRGLIRRTFVLPLGIALAFALYPVAGGEAVYDERFVVASILALLLVPAVVLTPWDRLPTFAQVGPLLGFLAVVALLRDGHGGAVAGYAPLLVVPLIWLAVYGTRAQLLTGLAAVAVALAVPILVVGDPAYPGSEWRRIIAFLFLGGVLGYSTRALLDRLFAEVAAREEAERQLREQGAFDLHDEVVQDLTAAQLALALDDRATARKSVARALARTQEIVNALLARPGVPVVRPGALRRTDVRAATSRAGDEPPG